MLKEYYPDAYITVEESDNNIFNKVRIPGILSRKQGDDIIRKIEERFGLKPIVLPEK